MINKVERAVSCFKDGFSCSQALLSIYGPEYGLDREMALKVSGAFGGGMGHIGETCGAVTGAFMIIGLKYGKTRVEDEQTREKAHSLVKEFVQEFKSRNGSIICRELIDCDISTPEGLKLAEEKGLFSTRCPEFVRDAAEIIEQILK
jgi:C_GCAxxG_C_C family probable redox protein